MSAMPRHKSKLGGSMPQMIRFAIAGLGATLLFVALTMALDQYQPKWPGFFSAFIAYAICSLYSYIAHKYSTFRSKGKHKREAPRFVFLIALGYVIAVAFPAFLHDYLLWPLIIPTVLVAVVVPCINFFGMQYFVFSSQ